MENPLSNKTSIVVITIALLGIGYLFLSGSKDADNSLTGETATSTETVATTSTNKSGTTTTVPPKKATTTAPKAASMTPDGLYIISYTNSGFSPATLTIKKGKGVRFINNSDKAMRVFADDKNSQIFGSLSQSKTVGRGGTYDFTFTQAGNWAYHNANNTADRGTVLVLE